MGSAGSAEASTPPAPLAPPPTQPLAATDAGTGVASVPRLVASQSSSSAATGHSQDSSSINDALAPRVDNKACTYGRLRLRDGAIFQGVICNKLDELEPDAQRDPETLVATFLTSRGECLQGVWLFERLMYDLESASPVAVYHVDVQVLLEDSSIHKYLGPAHVLLRKGEVFLPLAKDLLDRAPRNAIREATAARGKELLQLTLRHGSSENGLVTCSDSPDTTAEAVSPLPAPPLAPAPHKNEVRYARYPLSSPRGAAQQWQDGQQEQREPQVSPTSTAAAAAAAARRRRPMARRVTLTSRSTEQLNKVRRDHRTLFWSLCGKDLAPSRWDESIASDLQRTHFHRFLDRSPECAQRQLHSILRYVAIAFPNIGYCQGMHCVAKYLLTFSEAPVARMRAPSGQCGTRPPSPMRANLTSSVSLETEIAFVLFAQLLEDRKYRLQDLFNPDFSFYRGVLANIDQEIAASEPVLFRHLADHGLSAVVYAAKWILTLFTFYVDQDFSSVTNVWLRFLSQGWDAIIEIAVACVIGVKEHLLNSDSEGCMLILAGTTEATPHGVLETVFGTTRGQALLRDRGPLPEACSPARGLAAESSPSRTHSASDPPPLPPLPPLPRRKPAGNEDAVRGQTAVEQMLAADEARGPENGMALPERIVPARRYTHD